MKHIILKISCFALSATFAEANPLHFSGNKEIAKNKKIVFVIGDHEYKSETSMPFMAHLIAERHGFDCSILFTTDTKNGTINPNVDNIQGLEVLNEADLMVMFTRFRCLPDEQMQHIVNYLDSGKPVIGVRTSTHAFNYKKNPDSKFAKYSYNYKGDDYLGGFGKQVLGETWLSHWGSHKKESTRGRIAQGQEQHPILTGIQDGEIWGTTDIYEAKLPMMGGCTPILLGEALAGMTPDSPPAEPKNLQSTNHRDRKNSPMMPISWTYERPVGMKGRVFTTTIGGALSGVDDFENEGMRRLFVNACYWTLNLEHEIPKKADVRPTFTTNAFKRGAIPAEALKLSLPEE